MLAELVFRFTDELQGWIFVFACSFTYLCKAFFWDYDFWFDGYAYFFMLAIRRSMGLGWDMVRCQRKI